MQARLPKNVRDDRSMDFTEDLNVFGITDCKRQYITVLLTDKTVGNEDSDLVHCRVYIFGRKTNCELRC